MSKRKSLPLVIACIALVLAFAVRASRASSTSVHGRVAEAVRDLGR